MRVKLYSVFDSKLVQFSAPFSHLTDDSALRWFGDQVNDPQSGGWNKHPEDYNLFFIGEIVADTGELIPSHPRNLVTASALKVSQTPTIVN